MPQLLASQGVALACLLTTVVTYFVSKRLYKRYRHWWLSPMIVTPACLVSVVLLFAIPLPTYFAYSPITQKKTQNNNSK